MHNEYINHLNNLWVNFKNKRHLNAFFSDKEPDFITVLKREELIDILFEYIMENKKWTKK